ncbi:hypothetical protein D6C91_10433 [Aureobasidium pullulans]|uniref:Uncharacterized protein n=1 Tax=Aureobasidium pullulans TaxID=5580 RepID=A0A4S9S4F9_AURPU|nr:hypothetical protein D6C91_10433 [Aureobasidium pullulans]
MRRLEVQMHKFVWRKVSVYFLLICYRANLRAVTTECKNQSTEVRRNVAFNLISLRSRRRHRGFNIQDAGISSCVSGPRMAHAFLWFWFDVPIVKKARRGAESEEEHQVCDGSTLKRIPRCRPCPGVDAPLLKARRQGAEAVIESPEITQGLIRWFTTRRTGVISMSDLREVVPVSENSGIFCSKPESLLLVAPSSWLLCFVDAVTVGGADDTGWKVASRSVILPEMVTAMAMPDRGDLRSV